MYLILYKHVKIVNQHQYMRNYSVFILGYIHTYIDHVKHYEFKF